MATINDINTSSAVRKYLERPLVVSKDEDGADTSGEITALLETASLSFLLFPQMSLTLVLRAKNSFQQVVSGELGVVDFILAAVGELSNPDDPVADVSDLVDAQTALVELDRLGRLASGLPAYARYQAAIQSFLDVQLAKSLKRHGKGEFERSGKEARQDIFSSYYTLVPIHQSMLGRMTDLLASVTDFQSVDLSKIVSLKTLQQVRESLSQLQTGLLDNTISKTSAAIELLAGAASLQSISGGLGVYDPAIDTGSYPPGRIITADSDQPAAAALTTDGPWDLSTFATGLTLAVDEGTPVPVLLPLMSFLQAKYPAPLNGDGNYDIPAGKNLYIHYVEGGVPGVITVSLTSGERTPAQVAGEIATALGAHGTCDFVGTLLLRSDVASQMTILGYGEGHWDAGAWVPPLPSLHEVLGLFDGQTSVAMTAVTVIGLRDLLVPYTQVVIQGAAVQLLSSTVGAGSRLVITGDVATLLGIAGTFLPTSHYFTLMEKGVARTPASLGVYLDSEVSIGSVTSTVSRIDGTHVWMAQVPTGTGMAVKVYAPLVRTVQRLLRDLSAYRTAFDTDLLQLQNALAPIMGSPTSAQVADAQRTLRDMKTRLTSLRDLLASYFLDEARQQYADTVKDLLNGFEERSLDYAVELLSRGLFSQFFALDKDGASKGSRFMAAIEDVGRNELTFPTSEDEQSDRNSVPLNPYEKIVQTMEPSE
jgi:hypothetical protein